MAPRTRFGLAPQAGELLDHAASLGRRIGEQYRRGTVLGTFVIELPSRATIRALALAGFDFVVLDLEHSPFGIESLSGLITEAQLLGLPAIVRAHSHDGDLIAKILDIGANGIMAPRVSSAAQARAIVDAARYAPRGRRGLSPLISMANLPRPQMALDADILVIAQIEGKTGVESSGDISAVPGLSGVFLGPYDLSQAIGVPGEIDHPLITQAAGRIAANATGDCLLGTYVHDPGQSRKWAERGFRFQCVTFDARMLLERAREVVGAARGH